MIRGFVTGIAWGGVVAGVGLAVISQVAPRPVPPVEIAAGVVVPQPDRVVPAPVVAPKVPANPQPEATLPQAALPETAVPETAVPETVAPDRSEPATSAPSTEAPATTAPDPAASGPADPPKAVPPAVADLPPDAPDGVGAAQPIAAGSDSPPEVPQVPGPIAGADPAPPQALVAPDPPVSPEAAASAASDTPPPALADTLLVPPSAPAADRAPARIALDPGPVAEASPAPGTQLPLPDAAPDLPIAKPLPIPAPKTAVLAPDAPDPVSPTPKPAPGLEPVAPIITADAPRRLAPDPGLPLSDTASRLPRIGATEETQGQPSPADAPPMVRFARPFDNPDNKPLFAILLRDTGEANLDRAALAKISFPVTFVLDPMALGAAEAAAVYRRGGQEVLMLATGIPEGATAGDLEQTFQSLAGVLPEAVGVIDQPTRGFQGNRPLAAQVVTILAALGRGLVTFDVGLNAADQEARRAALPSAMIFRRLDAEGETTPTIRRYLDRAAFKAAQEGRVAVMGDTRPETVAALLEWAVEGRAASVSLAPITALLRTP